VEKRIGRPEGLDSLSEQELQELLHLLVEEVICYSDQNGGQDDHSGPADLLRVGAIASKTPG
jgi:hypothetical protein